MRHAPSLLAEDEHAQRSACVPPQTGLRYVHTQVKNTFVVILSEKSLEGGPLFGLKSVGRESREKRGREGEREGPHGRYWKQHNVVCCYNRSCSRVTCVSPVKLLLYITTLLSGLLFPGNHAALFGNKQQQWWALVLAVPFLPGAVGVRSSIFGFVCVEQVDFHGVC